MDRLEIMRAFAAVAAQRSFTLGARRLGISAKLASKYVARLEESLGVQLLHRTTRSVTLTETGLSYLHAAAPLLEEFDALEDLVRQRHRDLAGPIRLTAPTGFGSRELTQALAGFQTAHPQVEIELRLSDHHMPLVEEGIDLAVRFRADQDSTLVARKLCDMPIVVVAAPGYLATHGRPLLPQDLEGHRCLFLTSRATPEVWTFGAEVVRVQGGFRANSPRAVAHMAVSGLGVARCPAYCVAPFLRDGTLEPLLQGYRQNPVRLSAVYPQGRHLSARVRALLDHLVAHFAPMDWAEPAP